MDGQSVSREGIPGAAMEIIYWLRIAARRRSRKAPPLTIVLESANPRQRVVFQFLEDALAAKVSL